MTTEASTVQSIPIVNRDIGVVRLIDEVQRRLAAGEKKFQLIRLGDDDRIGFTPEAISHCEVVLNPHAHFGKGFALTLWRAFNLRGISLRFVRVADCKPAAVDVFVNT